jgi:hypothetical protein
MIMDQARRGFFKTTILAAAVAGLAVTGRPIQAVAETTSQSNSGEKFKIVDFRCRPPITPQELLFDVKLGRLKGKNRFISPLIDSTSPSMHKVGKDEGLRLLLNEMDDAGINQIVMPGRKISAIPEVVKSLSKSQSINVSDKMLAELRGKFNGRAIGLHGIDVEKPKAAVAEIETAVRDHGLPGAVLEVGYHKLPDGSPLSLDNPMLYPIYEALSSLDAVLMIQSGIYAGFDIGANDWPPLDIVLQKFPKMKVVLAHGGYPRVIDALALVTKHQNLYISPDVYTSFPGGNLYVEAISMLPDQFIFGSAYPFSSLKASVDFALQFPLTDEVMAKYLAGNAARILKLDL